MTTESEGHIGPFEKLNIRLDGYFDGRIDEIDVEIKVVGEWPRSIRLGNKIKRQDQELEWLNRLKDEMQRARAYINSSIERELEKQ